MDRIITIGAIKALSTAISEAYNNEKYTDAVLICNSKEFKIHRIIVSSICEFLKHKFEDGQQVITINNIEPETLSLILKFIYTGSVELEEMRLPSFLEATKFLQVKNIWSTSYDSSIQREDDTDFQSLLNIHGKSQNFVKSIMNDFQDLMAKSKDFLDSCFLKVTNSTHEIGSPDQKIPKTSDQITAVEKLRQNGIFVSGASYMGGIPIPAALLSNKNVSISLLREPKPNSELPDAKQPENEKKNHEDATPLRASESDEPHYLGTVSPQSGSLKRKYPNGALSSQLLHQKVMSPPQTSKVKRNLSSSFQGKKEEYNTFRSSQVRPSSFQGKKEEYNTFRSSQVRPSINVHSCAPTQRESKQLALREKSNLIHEVINVPEQQEIDCQTLAFPKSGKTTFPNDKFTHKIKPLEEFNCKVSESIDISSLNEVTMESQDLIIQITNLENSFTWLMDEELPDLTEQPFEAEQPFEGFTTNDASLVKTNLIGDKRPPESVESKGVAGQQYEPIGDKMALESVKKDESKGVAGQQYKPIGDKMRLESVKKDESKGVAGQQYEATGDEIPQKSVQKDDSKGVAGEQYEATGDEIPPKSVKKDDNKGVASEQYEVHKCYLCGSKHQSSETLELHLRIHNKETYVSCNTCEYKTHSKKALASHKAKKHRESFRKKKTNKTSK
ncbi:uncharacterized protein [Palaemon carinicauda]|uniref:uncharacterized protein n=1 Tax=Palaemon carinicauda TaxID=392227 RepID=UPI0035B5B994